MVDSKRRWIVLQVIPNLWRRFCHKAPAVYSMYLRATPPTDPFADRLVPVRRGPKGRSGAAVAEPEDDRYGTFSSREI